MNNTADLIFLNGSVLTLDSKNTQTEAVAVRGKKIVSMGRSLEMERLKGPQTRIIDLAGRTLMPGFIDAHCHAGIYGTAKRQVTCSGQEVNSIEDIRNKIRDKTKSTPLDQWILGRGYREFELVEGRHPNRWDLDKAAPDHKVFLMRTCGHIAVVNSRVLREFGIDKDTPDPVGGRFERDATGEPNGILSEQASVMIRMQARPSEDEIATGIQIMNNDFLELGITSIHDASGLFAEEIRQFQEAKFEETLKLRVYLMFRSSGGENRLGENLLESGLKTGFGNDHIKVGPYKLMLDGAGSSGTAAMLKPPPGKPNEAGILYFDQRELDTRLLKAHKAGYQIAVHAIGDRALEMVIDGFEKALKRYPRMDHRHRIEHFGFPSDRVLKKVKSLKLMPVLGLPFLFELGEQYYDNYGPEIMRRAYPLKKLIQLEIPAAMSSDTPVVGPNPLNGIYFALNRKSKSGLSIAPEEKVDLLQVLKSYTIYSAFASFDETIKGSLEIGKLADMVVLSENILKTPIEELLRLQVELTVIDGEIVFEKG